MEPIRQTRFALTEMSRFQDEDMTAQFNAVAAGVATIAPDCLGMTLSYIQDGLAFTWAASSLDVAALDAVQYVDGGPCVRAMAQASTIAAGVSHPLDEDNWLLFARAENTVGVESSLSIPLMGDGAVVGGVNFYGSTPTAFDGLHEQLAEQCGGWAGGAVTNAELSLSGVRRAKQAPQVLLDQYVTDQAIGMLMAAHRISADVAATQLHQGAERAGIHDSELARILVKSRVL
jgi:GAF domain-containing protein